MTSDSYFSRTLLMGVGCLTIIGCTVVDAIVSSPAAGTNQQTGSERLVAVGRVFESQGHIKHANRVYEMALKANPENEFASRRVAAISASHHQKLVAPMAIEQQIAFDADHKTHDFLPQQQRERSIAPASAVRNVSFSKYASTETEADPVSVEKETESPAPPLSCPNPRITFDLNPAWISEKNMSYLTDQSGYFGVGQ